MQVISVVPKVRTSGEGIFDYAIPPEILPMIRIGVLVLVPFHGRKVEGIVIDIKRSSKIANLKSLISIIDQIPVVDEIHIKLAHWMADYYITDFSKTLFENIVPPAKRTIKKINHPPNLAVRTVKFGSNKETRKYLIVADFQTRMKFYLQAIKKTLARHQQIIILVPDLSMIKYFAFCPHIRIKNKISIIHSGLTKTERWKEWDKIRRGETDIVIGSNSALFSPVQNLGLIIIDQEENETYKSGQSPRYHAIKVAEELSRLTAARLVLGSLTPRLETYLQAIENKYLFRKLAKTKPAIAIVDMNFERQVLSLPLQKKIEKAIVQKQKIILVLNRKGEGSKFGCSDCGWAYLCPQCQLPLIPYQEKTICYNCDKEFPLVEQCPRCQSFHLRPFGLTTKKLEKFIHDFWPRAKTMRIEKGEIISNINWNIAIVTSFALKFNFPPIGLVGVIDADQGLNFPDFRSAEKTFQTLYKFLRLGKEGIVQTHLPENSTIRNLAQMDYERFFLDEMENRRKFAFPPFSHLIRLLYRNIDESESKKESLKNFNQLKSLISISGPSPTFIPRQRGFYYYQILIKYHKELPEDIKSILKTLPRGWVVDVDPFDLI